MIDSQKHCQRHKGPEGWVLLTKVTYFSHITRSNTKFDQISSSEYLTSTNFKITTSANISISTKLKIQDIDQIWLQNLDQDSTSLPLQNISSKILTKLHLQNLSWTSTSKSWPSLVWTQDKLYDQTSAPKSAANCCQHGSQHQYRQQ